MAPPALQEVTSFLNITILETVDGHPCRLVEMSEETDRQPAGFYLCGPGTGNASNTHLGQSVYGKSNGYWVNYNTGRNGEYDPNLDMIRFYRADASSWVAKMLSETAIATNEE